MPQNCGACRLKRHRTLLAGQERMLRCSTMSKSRMMGAGAGGTQFGVLTSINQGGGSKKQGLVSTTNTPSRLDSHIRIRGGGENRNWMFCMNQLGGVGRRWGQAAGPGNRGGTSANCQALAWRRRQLYPPKPCGAGVRGWGAAVKFKPDCRDGPTLGTVAPSDNTCCGYVNILLDGGAQYSGMARVKVGSAAAAAKKVQSAPIKWQDAFQDTGISVTIPKWTIGPGLNQADVPAELPFLRVQPSAGTIDGSALVECVYEGGPAASIRISDSASIDTVKVVMTLRPTPTEVGEESTSATLSYRVVTSAQSVQVSQPLIPWSYYMDALYAGTGFPQPPQGNPCETFTMATPWLASTGCSESCDPAKEICCADPMATAAGTPVCFDTESRSLGPDWGCSDVYDHVGGCTDCVPEPAGGWPPPGPQREKALYPPACRVQVPVIAAAKACTNYVCAVGQRILVSIPRGAFGQDSTGADMPSAQWTGTAVRRLEKQSTLPNADRTTPEMIKYIIEGTGPEVPPREPVTVHAGPTVPPGLADGACSGSECVSGKLTSLQYQIQQSSQEYQYGLVWLFTASESGDAHSPFAAYQLPQQPGDADAWNLDYGHPVLTLGPWAGVLVIPGKIVTLCVLDESGKPVSSPCSPS